MDALTTTRNFQLTDEELASFRKNGYLGPFTLYSPEEMKAEWRKARLRLLDRSQAAYQDLDAVSGQTNIANYDRHLDDDFLADHIMRAEICDRVSGILGPEVICWRTEFFPKYPGDEGTDWHQADTFANASGKPQIVWPENREFGGTITVWTAFTDAMKDTGCLQFIPGTHTAMNYDETKRMRYDPDALTGVEKEGMRRGFFGYDYRELQIDKDWKPDEAAAAAMEMKAGQFIIFWSTLMHASYPHAGKTEEMRMGFASRYVPSSVHVYPDTDYVEEYGGKISLERYGSVQVVGDHTPAYNRMVTHTTRGKKFERG
ncbi:MULTISPECIES: syringomycin E biosynthesis L-threonyl-[L-threonyl-carrier protein] 4-chlorinase SyrB2 [Burkholderia]|uniref:syringomycin E biosynthesis L-threonyl-[L-threonyl-carrier protein] 4-chlorinase SyrB2 n=1 Tax=Burkholderia TaxID=32008 RepID=UPI001422C764|nr:MULTISPECIES: syringomycin E biosynthesis L-threonyl-[L-threonyl-carrier protein] 4-chlorinase SyrB2 [Burkholderia]NIE88841.1 chlorinating enzyme [Burkholderia sp. Tr-860]NIF67994.1 chlorinating enzyme [Burkholderia sp. Cy-647]NIG00218.1 chlorinating enzyme [Burkholderia sp. Ax-1720]